MTNSGQKPIIRPAALSDVPAIVRIHCADIVAWKRWNASGEARLVDYADLQPYERWLNGGPWLDETTYAPYLARLLAPGSGGVALVAEVAGEVRAVAEATLGDEPAPYGRHLDLSVIYVLRGYTGQGLGAALMRALRERAAAEGCQNLLVTHAEAPGFYARQGFTHLETWRRVRAAAQAANTQYAAEPFEPGPYDHIRGWAMPVGRYQSARQEWERARPGAEPAFEAWRGLRAERWRLQVRRQPAYLFLEEEPREPGTADAHLWLPASAAQGGLGPRQLISAVLDRAARAGLREVMLFVKEQHLPLIAVPWRDDGYKQQVWIQPIAAAQP